MAEEAKAGAGGAAVPGPLSVTSAMRGDIRVLTVSGEIDRDTGGTLREALDASTTTHPRVVADFQRVSFMDSSGISILLTAHRALTAAGGWLRLAAPSEFIWRTVRIVGLDTVVDCFPTLGEALDR